VSEHAAVIDHRLVPAKSWAAGFSTGPQPREWKLALVVTAVAIGLRLLMFAGRGDYIAFDEGWYLLLGRNFVAGDGYTLTGLPHTTLSPLFPIIAGAAALLITDVVWAGRVVAAVAAGLLVLPCWFIFHVLVGPRTARLGCMIVIAMPALSPFVAPYWIGWDLWVGAEPLMHLLLYSSLAFALAALHRPDGWAGMGLWVAAGCSAGLAYLTRPEAILTAGVLGLMVAVHAVRVGHARGMIGVVLLGLGFALTAMPYWLYLRDATGVWALSGRGVELMSTAGRMPDGSSVAPQGATASIEQMLWSDNQAAYLQRLYALDASGTRLASSYWGVRQAPEVSEVRLDAETLTPDPTPAPTAAEPAIAPETRTARTSRYFDAMARLLPMFTWPLLVLGIPTLRSRSLLAEAIVAVPLLSTSIAIAAVVAIDPRTQLLLVPLAAFYLARGVSRTGAFLDRRRSRTGLSRRFPGRALAALLIVVLLGTQARRLYMSLAVGSPHHLVGAENRRIGEALREALPPGEPVMSWHPAIALFARRDWRVLPQAEFSDVVRYANATGSTNIVLSAYYPSPLPLDDVPGRHLILRVPPAPAGTREWRLRATQDLAGYVTAKVESATP
jgi:hypothetical protein